MALPSSGQLSMSDINIELENPSTATITLNDDRVRTLLQRPNSASEIGMNAAYGKTDFSGFVSLSSETQAIYSSDGITWNTSTLPGSTNRIWPCVTFGNGKFVAAQGGTTGNETSTQGAWSLIGQTWNSMTLPAAKNWRTIAYGNGLFVLWSPGDTDNLATSADGINWTLRSVNTSGGDVRHCIFNGTIFLAISTNRLVLTSTDGITWSGSQVLPAITVGIYTTYWRCAWSPIAQRFVATINGITRQYAYSNDATGTSWTLGTFPGGVSGYLPIAYGNGIFVAHVGGSDQFRLSSDGITWESVTIPNSDAIGGYYEMAFGNGIFVLAGPGSQTSGQNRIASSPDGRTWTPRMTTFVNPYVNYYSVAFGGKTVNRGIAALIALGIGDQNLNSRYPLYSTDGINWTKSNWPPGLSINAYQWMVSFFSNDRYIAATNGSFPNTKIAYSTDGINWIPSNTSPINAAFNCGAFGNGVYVLLSSQGGTNMITSTDGINWTARTALANTGVSWSYMVFANGKFLATGDNSLKTATSTDGINWSIVTYPRIRAGGNYGNGMWIQAGPSQNNGRAYYYTSTDNAVTWTERTGPYQLDRSGFESPGGFNNYIYGNGKWVAWVSPYQSAYSTDGINWTTFMLPVGNYMYGLYSSRLGLFIIVGAAGTTTISGTSYTNNRVVTSPDGINWTVRTIPGEVSTGLFSVSVA